jgi:PPOX class probable F420-dependent enzyme
MTIDPGTKTGARALERLASDKIAWLTSVTPDGQPQSMPVWFLWLPEGELLVYSAKHAVRNRNVRANPKVAIHFSDDGDGGDIVSIDGEAVIDAPIPPASANEPYLAKYGAWIAEYEWTPESFAADYPVPLRIRPTKVRGG